MYLHLGKGKSMKNYDGYPKGMIIHNKASHHLYSTPEDTDFFLALRRIQVLYMGGNDYIFNALMRSNILRERVTLQREEFWLTVMKFFVENTMIEPSKISEVIDYIQFCKYQPGPYINGRMTPPLHPNFSMKGRNPVSLINQSDEWHFQNQIFNRGNRQHAQLGHYIQREVVDYSWNGLRISNDKIKRGKNKFYEIIQLKSFFELRDEGNYMHHCVASYAGSCKNGSCGIFSVREYVGDAFLDRTATIEVRGNSVVQVRGKYNRQPDDNTIKSIKEWSEKTKLTFSQYAL